MIGLHDQVQQQLTPLFDRWSFYGYEARFIVAWYALFVPLCPWLAVRLARRSWRLLALCVALLLLMAAVDSLWLATMSERVHYLQYAVLALGLRVLLGSPALALAVAALIGVGDEAYQAFVLYADRPDLPLDFKDMGLNVIGACLGMLIYEALRRPAATSSCTRQ